MGRHAGAAHAGAVAGDVGRSRWRVVSTSRKPCPPNDRHAALDTVLMNIRAHELTLGGWKQSRSHHHDAPHAAQADDALTRRVLQQLHVGPEHALATTAWLRPGYGDAVRIEHHALQ